MPNLNINGAKIYYEVSGIGPETMVFAHGIFFSSKVFKDQVDYFKARYKCVVFDFRGQGRSQDAEFGYDMDMLTADVIELVKRLNLGPCHFVGMCTGGFVGIRMASRHREWLKSLILIDTSSEVEPNKLKLNFFKSLVRYFGITPVSSKIMKMLFGDSFLADPGRESEISYWKNELVSNNKSIHKAFSGYIGRSSVMGELGNVPMPTLIIVGEEDTMTIPEKSKNMKLKIPQARLAIIKGAGHTSTVEQPWQVIDTIEVFLNGVH